MIDKILIAVDDSAAAMHAADYSIKLANELQAKVGIVCVTDFNLGNIDAGITPRAMEMAMQRRNDILIDEINITHPGVEIEEFDPIGHPFKEIENIIELWSPDLLVIGHRNHNFFNKIFGQHIERKLLKHIKIPILIIP